MYLTSTGMTAPAVPALVALEVAVHGDLAQTFTPVTAAQPKGGGQSVGNTICSALHLPQRKR